MLTRSFGRLAAVAPCAGLLTLASVADAQTAFPPTVLLATGDSVGGVDVTVVDAPTINQSGMIGIDAGSFFWRPTPSSPTQLFIANGTAVPGGIYAGGNASALDSAGRLLGSNSVPSPLPFVDSLAVGPVGGVRILARRLGQVPGFPVGELFRLLARPVASDAGNIFFFGDTFSGTSGLWTSSGGADPTLLFRGEDSPNGSPAPGLAGRTIQSISPDIQVTRSGTVAWQASTLQGVGTRTSVFVGSGSSFVPVLSAGDRVGTLFAGAAFGARMNDAGDLTLGTSLYEVSDISGSSVGAVMRRSASGQLSLVARGNTRGPGMRPGEVWSSSSFQREVGPATITNAGDIVFAGSIRSFGVPDDQGLWRQSADGQLTLIARKGTRLELQPALQLFQIDNANFVANAAGDVVFSALLSGAGVTSANDLGIFVHNPALGVRLIAREGDLIQLAPGDARTIASLRFISNTFQALGSATSLNDARQFVYVAEFTDGSSAALSITIPTPGAAGLLVLSGVVALRHRRNA